MICASYFCLILLGLTDTSEHKRMEKNKLSNNLKDNGIVTRAIRDSNNKRIIHCSQSCEEDYINGFSWPPRSYTCSFCKREFRSAQALGGHMNVHRKDRARLKNSPPIDAQYTSTIFNPNPNFLSTSSPSSSSSLVLPFSSSLSLPSLISPPLPPPPIFSVPSSENMKWVVGGTLFNHPLNLKASDLITKLKSAKSLCGVGDHQCGGFIGQEDQDGCMKTLKKAADPHQIRRLDLEIGMFGDTKEDLDLELRLGYS